MIMKNKKTLFKCLFYYFGPSQLKLTFDFLYNIVEVHMHKTIYQRSFHLCGTLLYKIYQLLY